MRSVSGPAVMIWPACAAVMRVRWRCAGASMAAEVGERSPPRPSRSRSYRQRREHGGCAAVVVGLWMGDDERVEPADARDLELAGDAGAGGPGVDEDRVAAGLQQRRVALADVQRGHAEGAVGRRRERARREQRGAERRGDGDQDGGGEQGAAAAAARAALRSQRARRAASHARGLRQRRCATGHALGHRCRHEHGGQRAEHDERRERQRHLRAGQPGGETREADEVPEQRTGDGHQRRQRAPARAGPAPPRPGRAT